MNTAKLEYDTVDIKIYEWVNNNYDASKAVFSRSVNKDQANSLDIKLIIGKSYFFSVSYLKSGATIYSSETCIAEDHKKSRVYGPIKPTGNDVSVYVCNDSNQNQSGTVSLSEQQYKSKFKGFMHGVIFGNFTGLITEVDKTRSPFYTEQDWGKPDSIKQEGRTFSNLIQYWVETSDRYKSDDDTAIEMIYLKAIHDSPNLVLTGQEIRTAWLNGIDPNWVWWSNKHAYTLMQQSKIPPATTDSRFGEKIDAQLTTEIIGLLAAGKPNLAVKMGTLPVQTTASGSAASIALFYIKMHALAGKTTKPTLTSLAEQSKSTLTGYALKMYDHVKQLHSSGKTWTQARDEIYERYQRASGTDGYTYQNEFDAGINFACSLVSLFWGNSSLLTTVKIGSLCGWDSDNPTATWAGLIGFIEGEESIKAQIKSAKPSNYSGGNLPSSYNIGQTTKIEEVWTLDQISTWAWNIYQRAQNDKTTSE